MFHLRKSFLKYTVVHFTINDPIVAQENGAYQNLAAYAGPNGYLLGMERPRNSHVWVLTAPHSKILSIYISIEPEMRFICEDDPFWL